MTLLEQIRDLALKGVGRMNVEAVIGHRLDEDELTCFRKAQSDLMVRRAEKKARGPMTTAERVRKHVAAANDIGRIDPKPRHRRLKERCRFDLELFGWYYCRRVLKHRASKHMREGLIRDVQDAILHGGQSVKMYGRGAGKTTWTVYIATVWALVYGHRRWPVLISANARLGKANLRTVKRLLTRSKELRSDFPEIVVPLSVLGDISQRAASVTYCGKPTDMEWSSDRIALPMLRGDDGKPLGPGCGARVTSVGIGGAVRGANEEGQRPDFLLLDDPQTPKIAHSPSLVDGVIRYIHNDALSLSGHDRLITAFVTITPQCFGDVATELTSQSKHPEWSVTVEPFLIRLPQKWSELVAEFLREYQDDAANNDYERTRSTRWYRQNRARFASAEVIDPDQFDVVAEVDAIHHMLNLRARIGEAAFNAEIMMKVADLDSELDLSADRVACALNGAPRGVCPPGTDAVLGFVDVNIRKGKGLSWGLVAFGPQRVAAVIAYGRYPEHGPLVPPGSSDLARNRAVAAAIKIVTAKIAALKIRDTKNRKIPIRALGFDRGYLPDVVHRALYVIRKTTPLTFPLVAVRGFPWNKFGTRPKDMLRRGDHIFATRSQYGEYLAEMAPYWREVMQSGFLETPLMPGSLSIYGKNPAEHYELANEITAEKLVRKYPVETRGKTETAWDWTCTGDNHYCDVLTGCFALASWYRAFDNLSRVVDTAAISGNFRIDPTGRFRMDPSGRRWVVPSAAEHADGLEPIHPHTAHQDDLFDPGKNEAVLAAAGYDGALDETEGTLDNDVAPFPGDVESSRDPLVDASPVPRRKVMNKLVKPVYKFKRGRYKK